MFAHDTFVAIFGAARPGELEILASLIRGALREGYAVVLNEPGTKKPLCTLTAATRKKADRDTHEADLAAGAPNPRRAHPCGIHHALFGEDDAKKVTGLITRLTKTYGAPPNIGLEPCRSRMVCVDVDTAEQRDAFLTAWAAELPDSPPPGYTVRSPGARRPDGTWAHADGGHYWFRVPEGRELPTGRDGRGVLTADEGWSIIWADLQVLVPPSVRPEGPYECVGMPLSAPAWLLDRVEAEVVLRVERERLRLERRAERDSAGGLDPVDEWSASTSWDELLEAQGWFATGRPDTCGCPTWTAPGPHGSPKSATSHDIGCSRFDADDGHAPLHVWTDNPPDYLQGAPRTLTKLTHEAYAGYGGDESAAVIGLGLAVGGDGGPMIVDDPFDLMRDQSSSGAGPCAEEPVGSPEVVDLGEDTDLQPGEHGPGSPAGNNGSGEPGPDATGEPDEFSSVGAADSGMVSGLASDVSEPSASVKQAPRSLLAYDSSDLDGLPDPDPLIFGLLDRQSVAILSGKFGTYKSFLALDWACHLALGRPWHGHDVDQATPVVYIAAEGQVGVKRRVRGWRRRHLAGEQLPRGALTVIPQRVVLETDKDGKATAHLRELVELVTERGAGLVVFDTLSKSKGKADDNSNAEMSALMALVIELTRATRATVLLVAHTGYSGEHTRGASSQEDDVDTVFVIRFDDPKNEDRGLEVRRVLHHRKSKDGELSPPLVLVPRVESLGIDDHGREVTTLTLSTDPWEDPAVRREVDAARKVREFLQVNPGAPAGDLERIMGGQKGDGTFATVIGALKARGEVRELSGGDLRRAGHTRKDGSNYAWQARAFFVAGDEPEIEVP